MNNDNLPKKLTYEEFEDKRSFLAGKYGFKIDKKTGEKKKISYFNILDIDSYLLYEELHSIKELLIDSKMMPDSRFDHVAEEIDELKKEVNELKKPLKKRKQESKKPIKKRKQEKSE